ncbi:mitochondrial import receptor subunit TOM9-2-like [Canna indica]|uniref:Mitochondrial import receptor subunit TOM9-2-like n=1 Tax=Canna indica TaxID=4628 RepID=A0AAQ3QHX8_9LILI|nr:mitochondrial import receptor subunit TOM9-2-like [Canna indica]
MFVETRTKDGKALDDETEEAIEKLKTMVEHDRKPAAETFQSMFGKEKSGRVRCYVPVVARGKAAVVEAGTMAKKLIRITVKAAWIVGTAFLVLSIHLFIEMDREQQLNDLEM